MGMLSTGGNSGNAAFVFILKVIGFIIVLLFLFELGLAQTSNSIYELRTPLKHEKPSVHVNSPIKLGFGIGTQISGNGHGTLYNANLNFTKTKSIYTVGVCIQKRSLSVAGIKMSYARNLTGRNFVSKAALRESYYEDDGGLMLSVFSFLQYTHNTSLGYRAAKIETKAQVSDGLNRSLLKLSTAEFGLGVEINCRLYKNMYLKNFLGASFYYHFNYVNGMYREMFGQVLMLGTCIDLPYLKSN